jgi:hypothetical protein
VSGDGHKIVTHVVDDSGRWSNRGTMAVLASLYGDAAEALYSTGALELGQIQTNKVSKKGSPHIVLCNLIAQEYKQKKGEASRLSYEHLESALKQLGKLIIREQKNLDAPISAHLARIHYAVPNLDWDRVDKLLHDVLIDRGIDVTVYSKDRTDNDRIKKNKKPRDEVKKEEKETKKAEDKMDVDNDISDDDKTDDELPAPSSPALHVASKDSIMDGCSILISGYSPDETQEIAQKIAKMGGIVQTKLKMIGEGKTSHLICESFTETFEKLNGIGFTNIVRRVSHFS